MNCTDCGTAILDALGKANGGRCKPCARKARQAMPPEHPDSPQPEPEVLMEQAPVPQPVLPPLPEGFRYVYNRTDQPYAAQFDLTFFTFTPHEIKMVPCGTAEAIRDWSVINGTVRNVSHGTLKGERALALGPGWSIANSHKQDDETWVHEYAPAEPEPDFLVPTTTEPGVEWFDRQSVPNYTDRPSRENVPTTAKLIRV